MLMATKFQTIAILTGMINLKNLKTPRIFRLIKEDPSVETICLSSHLKGQEIKMIDLNN